MPTKFERWTLGTLEQTPLDKLLALLHAVKPHQCFPPVSAHFPTCLHSFFARNTVRNTDNEYREYLVVRTRNTGHVTAGRPRWSHFPVAMEDDDPLQWELDQVDKLDKLATVYGWDEDHKDYKTRLKLIQVQSVARQKANAKTWSRGATGVRIAGAEAVTKAVAVKRFKPVGWETVEPLGGKRFKSFSNAKALLGPPDYGPWISDRDAPSGTKPQEWRRFISIDKETGDFIRHRIIRSKGVSRDSNHSRPSPDNVPAACRRE